MNSIKDWTKHFLKYKDTVLRRIEKIEETHSGLTVHMKSGEKQVYLCIDYLENIKVSKNLKISCLNSKKNLDWVLDNWEDLVDNSVSLLFANPSKSQSWALNTASHHAVSEKDALKTGLTALYESVPSV